MRFKNIVTKKRKYKSGDVLFVRNEHEEEVCMVIKKEIMYNLIDLNKGRIYLFDNQHYDDFVRKLESLFTSIEVIDNNKLELVRVED